MRRSHIVLACAVALAGAAATLASHDGTSAEVRGAPLDPIAAAQNSEGIAEGPGAPHGALAITSRAAAGSTEVPRAPLADLVDLDQVVLSPDGDRYEAVLKDGRRAVLTLDPAIQAYAERLLLEAHAPRGAIVAMAPDGRILALAGRRSERRAKTPAPDGASSQTVRKTALDWRLAIDVWAPAASVFKLVTATALVEAGVDPSDRVCYHGGIRSVRESNLHDDKRDSRCESLTYGVAHSNNAILGKLAFQKLEPSALSRAAQALGVAQGLPGSELRGLAGAVEIPASRDLSFAQTAAGFTGSRLSAVGGALLAATFADDGEQPVPRLVASIDGVVPPVPVRRRAIPSDVARAVGRMMLATCELGSAARSFGKHQAIRVAGKTGTLTRTELSGPEEPGPPGSATREPFAMEHSWFVGYAPVEQPQIIVSVLLGNSENWRLRGHEAARRLIDRALGHMSSEHPSSERRSSEHGSSERRSSDRAPEHVPGHAKGHTRPREKDRRAKG